jgi:DNA-binding CsgD family transcriptional regulator
VAGIGGNQLAPDVRQLARERERQCLELRLRGATFVDIGKQIGISAQGAEKSYKRALRRIPQTEALACRKEQRERLDRLRVRAWNRLGALPVGDPGVDLAVQSALRIEQRESKLLGLDAPRQLEVQQHEDPSTLVQKELNQAMLARLSIDEKRQLLALIPTHRRPMTAAASGELDLSGVLLSMRGWTHLKLPAEA